MLTVIFSLCKVNFIPKLCRTVVRALRILLFSMFSKHISYLNCYPYAVQSVRVKIRAESHRLFIHLSYDQIFFYRFLVFQKYTYLKVDF